MKIVADEKGGVVVVTMEGEVDMYNAPEMQKLFRELIEREKFQIVLNLGRVHYLDSSGLGVLMDMQRKVVAGGGAIKLVAVRESIARVFELTQMKNLFEFHGDEESACASFG